MIGIVIVSHACLAQEFLTAAEHVVGKQKNFIPISIENDDDADKKRQAIVDAVTLVQDGDGVIILTDMFGGTPSNMAISVMEAGKVEVVAGVNLPMLIKLCSIRKTAKLEDAIATCQEAGRKYINVASQLLATQ